MITRFVMVAGAALVNRASSCPLGVEMQGDPSLTRSIEERLRADGFAVSPSCSEAIIATWVGTRIRLQIVEPFGRITTREVRELDTAIALIESFARAAPEQDREEPMQLLESHGASPPTPSRTELSLVEETSFGSDGSVWLGARGEVCRRWGPVCIGAVGRYGRDAEISGSGEANEAQRTAADAMVGLAWSPVNGVRFGAGVGLGWLRVRRDYMAPSDGSSDTIEIDSFGLRGEARVGYAVPLTSATRLLLSAGVALSPLAHAQPFSSEGQTAPGEPRGYATLGVGLEVSP